MKYMLWVVLPILLAAITVGNAFAISLPPGDYEIINWIESANSGTGRLQTTIEHIGEHGKYSQEACKVVSNKVDGDTVKFELSCKFQPPIFGQFTFNDDSFEGQLSYRYKTNAMTVGMRGTQIKAATEKPSVKVDAEIDKKLQELWNRMKTYMSRADIDNALKLCHPDLRKHHREYLEALQAHSLLQLMGTERTVLKPRKIYHDQLFATYELVTGSSSSEVVFKKGPHDNWFIADF